MKRAFRRESSFFALGCVKGHYEQWAGSEKKPHRDITFGYRQYLTLIRVVWWSKRRQIWNVWSNKSICGFKVGIRFDMRLPKFTSSLLVGEYLNMKVSDLRIFSRVPVKHIFKWRLSIIAVALSDDLLAVAEKIEQSVESKHWPLNIHHSNVSWQMITSLSSEHTQPN